jgi:SCF-associated factor 1
LSGPTVRHVSASFNSITSYSTTKAYSVKFVELLKQNPEFATVKSPNEGLPVRKVVMGDYHAVACDHSGAAFAWGENTAGQLGRGEIGARNVGDLAKPAIIEFGRGDERIPEAKASQRYSAQFPDHNQRESTGDFKPDFRTRRFVFDVAAGGWQSGALVVDMRDYCATDSILPNVSSSSRQDHSPSLSSKGEVDPSSSDIPQRQATSASLQVPDGSAAESETTPDNSGNTAEHPSEPPRHPQGIPIRRGGLPFIRIGFAGRGAVRGGPGFNVPRP